MESLVIVWCGGKEGVREAWGRLFESWYLDTTRLVVVVGCLKYVFFFIFPFSIFFNFFVFWTWIYSSGPWHDPSLKIIFRGRYITRVLGAGVKSARNNMFLSAPTNGFCSSAPVPVPTTGGGSTLASKSDQVRRPSQEAGWHPAVGQAPFLPSYCIGELPLQADMSSGCGSSSFPLPADGDHIQRQLFPACSPGRGPSLFRWTFPAASSRRLWARCSNGASWDSAEPF